VLEPSESSRWKKRSTVSDYVTSPFRFGVRNLRSPDSCGIVLFFRPELPIYNLQNHTHGRLFKMLKSDSLIKSQSVIQYALIKTHLRHYAVIRGLPMLFEYVPGGGESTRFALRFAR
jgi:hypothetical protein